MGTYIYRMRLSNQTYNFEYADIPTLFEQFNNAESMAKTLLEKQLSLPAYEQVLTASHTFNLLDARHAIGVTERARYIGRVRNLARDVAQVYYDSREKLGFPRGKVVSKSRRKSGGLS